MVITTSAEMATAFEESAAKAPVRRQLFRPLLYSVVYRDGVSLFDQSFHHGIAHLPQTDEPDFFLCPHENFLLFLPWEQNPCPSVLRGNKLIFRNRHAEYL